MKVLILGEDDVRRLLDMEACIAAMEDVLAALARAELSMPLRFIVRPPGPALLGLMPAYRGGGDPLFSLKEIVVSPGNSARGLDPHQGTVILHDGETGLLRAVLNASAITEIRTAAVSAVATKRLARPGARVGPCSARACKARSHVQAMQAVVHDPEIRIWSRNPAHAEALALESALGRRETVEDALAGADDRLHDDGLARADRSTRVAHTRRARERRRLVDPDRA